MERISLKENFFLNVGNKEQTYIIIIYLFCFSFSHNFLLTKSVPFNNNNFLTWYAFGILFGSPEREILSVRQQRTNLNNYYSIFLSTQSLFSSNNKFLKQDDKTKFENLNIKNQRDPTP